MIEAFFDQAEEGFEYRQTPITERTKAWAS